MQSTIKNRTIFCNDNLDVLRRMNSKQVDLIYLDPPFNKNRAFTKPIGDSSKKVGFDDIFREDSVKKEWLGLIDKSHPKVSKYICAIGEVGHKTNRNYLCFMAIRLIQCHRVLKDTGSLYLHCDDTMGSHLKLLMDCIFGESNFRNQIAWKRDEGKNDARKKIARNMDYIFYYTKSNKYTLNPIFVPLSQEESKKKFKYLETETGRRYSLAPLQRNKGGAGADDRLIYGKKFSTNTEWTWTQKTFDERLKDNPHLIHINDKGTPYYKIYEDEHEGYLKGDLWDDIARLTGRSKERVGYSTQKPLALLKRIILASSNKGDWVLDPFCGCATTCVAAEIEGRNWIGIDSEPTSYAMIKTRVSRQIEAGNILFNTTTKLIMRKGLPERTDRTKPKMKYGEVKAILYGQQWGNCKACKGHFEMRHMEIDHEEPKSRGGGDDLGNLQLLCGHCNRRKGNKSMAYLLAELRKDGII